MLGNFYLLPKIQKILSKVPGHPVISNCGMPMEKISEFLYHNLQPFMKEGELHINDTGYFLETLKAVGEIPKEVIFITADVVRFYRSIAHGGSLEVFWKQYDKFKNKVVLTKDIKMADLVIKNNLLIVNFIRNYFIRKF